MILDYARFKSFVIARKLSVQYEDLDTAYDLTAIDGPIIRQCVLQKDGGADHLDFDATLKPTGNAAATTDVTTRMEKDDKTLTTVYAYGVTDVNGRVEARFPIPAAGRFLAYGDAEFEVRHFFDRIISICVRDDDRLIAWDIALQLDPEAIAPLSDEDTATMAGIPTYPVLGEYGDAAVPLGAPIFTGGPPAYGPGMSMTLAYGITEVSPVGGYAFVPGNFWFVVIAQKGERCPVESRANIGFSISVDGAELDP